MTSIEISNIVNKWFGDLLNTGCESLSGADRHEVACDFLDGMLDAVFSSGGKHEDENRARQLFWSKCEAKRIAGEIVIY